MNASGDSNQLAGRRYVIVILRLLLDRRGRLVHGVAIDIGDQHRVPFDGWRALTRAVRSLVDRERTSTQESDQPDPDDDGLWLTRPIELGCVTRRILPAARWRYVAGRAAEGFPLARALPDHTPPACALADRPA